MLLPIIAFVLFLAAYFVLRRHQRGFPQTLAGRAMWEQTTPDLRRQLRNMWVFAVIAIPIVLVQAHTSWLIRGVAFVGMLCCLSLASIWILSRGGRDD